MNLPTLKILPESLAIVKCARMEDALAVNGAFFSLTRTSQEISLVCEVSAVPANAVEVSRPWRCIAVVGPLDFSLTGILAPIATILAEARISIFALSSYDTDFILVRAETLEAASEALQQAGYKILSQPC